MGQRSFNAGAVLTFLDEVTMRFGPSRCPSVEIAWDAAWTVCMMSDPRHEAAAAHMAGAYARLTGRLGVCMASNGPGVANVLPGVAVEQGEGNRVLEVREQPAAL